MSEATMSETRAERRSQMNRAHARELRNNSTKTERLMWSILRREQVDGLRFRRQQPIGPYIADFFCPTLKLIVELDGGQHYEPEALAYDERRTHWLAERGYTVLRFPNADVAKWRRDVIDRITAAAKEISGKHPE
ncbi:MAG TPA: endonuclease domain-containing protein [Rhizomicrobium sp.]